MVQLPGFTLPQYTVVVVVVLKLKTTTLLLPLSSQLATLLFIVHIFQQHIIEECIYQDLEIEISMLLKYR